MIKSILNKLTKADNIQPVTGLDSTFLYIETPSSHMHIGGVNVIEGSLDFDTFRSILASSLHQIPKMRKKLAYVPFKFDYPYWVDDPEFDIDMHLQHISLPKPGDWSSLRKVASQIFSQALDHSRPLWQMTFIEGLENLTAVPKGSVAIISKMHHVAIDGLGGADILSLLYDFSSEKKPIQEPRPYNPKPIPNELKMMLNSTRSFVENPLKFPRIITNTLAATIKTGVLSRANKISPPTSPFTAPNTPLNGIISPRRMWNATLLSLDRLKVLKNKMGTTLNDVFLAVCAGALRRYLEEKNKLPDRPLVAMVPISTRGKSEEDKQGNNISSMLVQLATNIEDPLDRLEAIHENTLRGKSYQGAIGAKTLANMAEVVPFGIANQAAKMYSRFQISELHKPMFNLTITNVPGPKIPLYINGHKLHSVMGMAPIMDGMGLIITIFSYDGKVTMSATSDAKSMPDVDVFVKYLRESANEMEEAVKKMGVRKKKKKAKQIKKSIVKPVFDHLRKQLKANAEFIKPDNGIFLFNITGEEEVLYKIDLNKSPATIRKGSAADPDVTLTVKAKHLVQIGSGKLKLQTAFVQGRLKIEGASEKALKLGSILSKLEKM